MKTKIADVPAACPELSPGTRYPPFKFRSLNGKVSAKPVYPCVASRQRRGPTPGQPENSIQ